MYISLHGFIPKPVTHLPRLDFNIMTASFGYWSCPPSTLLPSLSNHAILNVFRPRTSSLGACLWVWQGHLRFPAVNACRLMYGSPSFVVYLLQVFLSDRVSLEFSILTGLMQLPGIQVTRLLPLNASLPSPACQDPDTSTFLTCAFVLLSN